MAVSIYRSAAMRAGVPGDVRELRADRIETNVNSLRTQLHTFRRGGGGNPGIGQLVADAAIALQRSFMELVGRHPALGKPGMHGRRIELFQGLLEAGCYGNGNQAHYAPLYASSYCMLLSAIL